MGNILKLRAIDSRTPHILTSNLDGEEIAVAQETKLSGRQEAGLLGEELVARWLSGRGWQVLHRRWRCRYGEIDAIARRNDPEKGAIVLAFVEVKTRNRYGIDAGGSLAVNPRKQVKLRRTAEFFLSRYPQYAEALCRFDVALVQCRRMADSDAFSSEVSSQENCTSETFPESVERNRPIFYQGYAIALKHYFAGAFC